MPASVTVDHGPDRTRPSTTMPRTPPAIADATIEPANPAAAVKATRPATTASVPALERKSQRGMEDIGPLDQGIGPSATLFGFCGIHTTFPAAHVGGPPRTHHLWPEKRLTRTS